MKQFALIVLVVLLGSCNQINSPRTVQSVDLPGNGSTALPSINGFKANLHFAIPDEAYRNKEMGATVQ